MSRLLSATKLIKFDKFNIGLKVLKISSIEANVIFSNSDRRKNYMDNKQVKDMQSQFDAGQKCA